MAKLSLEYQGKKWSISLDRDTVGYDSTTSKDEFMWFPFINGFKVCIIEHDWQLHAETLKELKELILYYASINELEIRECELSY